MFYNVLQGIYSNSAPLQSKETKAQRNGFSQATFLVHWVSAQGSSCVLSSWLSPALPSTGLALLHCSKDPPESSISSLPPPNLTAHAVFELTLLPLDHEFLPWSS